MEHSGRHHLAEPKPPIHGGHAGESIDAAGYRAWPADSPCHALHLDSCFPFEQIAVRTRMSDYEVVVLPGGAGEVLVRGGRYFSEFRRARLVGSTFGGSAIRVMTIEVGCRLELRVDGHTILTSPIQAVSRVRADHDGPGAM